MHLLTPLYLVLNATRDSNVTLSEEYYSVCSKSSDGYDPEACHMYVVGSTRAQLHARASADGAPSLVAMASEEANCSSRFYVFGFDEFEALYPSMRSCLITTYGAVVQAAAMEAPCRTRDKGEAKFLMVPPYQAFECNWPAYGESCHGTANVHRLGTQCDGEALRAASEVRRDHPERQVLVVEQTAAVHDLLYLPVPSTDPGMVFARVNAVNAGNKGKGFSPRPTNYRRGLDISMPPSATPRCARISEEAFREPLGAKRYFLSFKGRLNQDMRVKVRRSFHNGKDVVIAGSDESEYDYDTLLRHSRFNLILTGDMEFSFRFNEAVCSGGVPVMIADRWVPPFNEFVPFDTYGVYMRPFRFDACHPATIFSQWDLLLEVLRSMPDAEVQAKRERAQAACRRYFTDTWTQVRQLLGGLLAHARAPNNETETRPQCNRTEGAYVGYERYV